jgi:hypothetical protein
VHRELLIFARPMVEASGVQIALTGSIPNVEIKNSMAIVIDAIVDYFQMIYEFVVTIRPKKAQCSVIPDSVFPN